LNNNGEQKLEKQLTEWGTLYKFYRLHGGLGGETTYEIRKKKLTF